MWALAVFLQLPVAFASNPAFLDHELSQIQVRTVTVADDIYSFRDTMKHSGFLKDILK